MQKESLNTFLPIPIYLKFISDPCLLRPFARSTKETYSLTNPLLTHIFSQSINVLENLSMQCKISNGTYFIQGDFLRNNLNVWNYILGIHFPVQNFRVHNFLQVPIFQKKIMD